MINERLTFGIDLGIGSCGWAVLRHADAAGEPGVIEGMGSWCFDVPETSKERTPTNEVRRSNRLLRRVIRRRRNRMAEIRRLFHAQGLLPSADEDALKRPRLDPFIAPPEVTRAWLRWTLTAWAGVVASGLARRGAGPRTVQGTHAGIGISRVSE